MTDYQKILEEFRTHYRNKYDINFDDEILYFFVRLNEMQMDLKKEIRNVPTIIFKSGWEYFLYGLGKWLVPSLIVTLFLSTVLFINTCNRPARFAFPAKILTKNNLQYLELKTDSSLYYLPIKTIKP